MTKSNSVSDKSAKFFCENCGAEVPQNAKMCRKCGRFFSSVRCPACGKTGSSDEFSNGCPKCGYAVGNPNSSKKTDDSKYYYEKPSISRNKMKKDFAFFDGNKKSFSDEKVPAWIFIIAVIVLFGILGLLLLKF